MNKEFYKNLSKYQVLTPSGFKPFAGISLMAITEIYRVDIEDGIFLECTKDHKIFINGDENKEVKDLKAGDNVLSIHGFKKILSISNTGRIAPVYDLIEVEDGHQYYTNDILSSNCEFITFEETLINPMKLAKITGRDPLSKTGQVRWYEPIQRNMTYVVSLDPSMGTGGDNAAIQIFELPSLKQVGEWNNNKTSIEDQIRTLKKILEEIDSHGHPEIYWSVESNSMGEAVLVVIRESGEEAFPGTMLHDPKNKMSGKVRRGGFITTHKSKLEACAKLKFLVENGKLQINSRMLISELKSFVAKANSYEARQGLTDDLISATLLFLRMSEFISTWDESSYKNINSSIISGDDEDYESPMPIII